MATTQEYYRLQGRQPRYATTLATFANGMYITNQLIPEGYAKYLVNYDIDDTGTFIYPKKGKVIHTEFENCLALAGSTKYSSGGYGFKPQGAHIIGTVWLDDIDDRDGDGQLESNYALTLGTVDVIWSLGSPIYYDSLHGFSQSLQKVPGPYYLFDYLYTQDDNTVEKGQEGYDPNKAVKLDYKTGWAIYHDEATDEFKQTQITSVAGTMTPARPIKDAWAFDKKFIKEVYRPIYSIYNNTIVMFSKQRPIVTYAENLSPRYRYNDDVWDRAQLCYFKMNRMTINYGSYDYSLVGTSFDSTNIKVATATTMGFNMLAEDPYTFKDTSGTRNIPLGIMAYAKDNNGNFNIPVMNPTVGTTTRFRIYCQYTSGTDVDYDVEYLDLNSYAANDTDHWVNLTSEGGSYHGPITIDWAPISDKFLMRVTFYTGGKDTDAGKASAYPYTRAFQCITNSEDMHKLEKYELSSAKGMINWQNCIGVYGVSGAVDGIFFSDVDNPGYFPFPNNVMTFDGAVLAVYNYLNNLLVVTNKSFWLVTMGVSIQTSIQTKVLDNLDMTEIDATNIVILKDEIFFKSGNAFYVLKPNKYTSDNSDLKKYLNSTAISNFLNNFTDSVLDLLNTLYKIQIQELSKKENKDLAFIDFDVYDTHSYLKDEEVHYIYTINPRINIKGTTPTVSDYTYGHLDLHLVYNTLTRAWRIYLVPKGNPDIIGNNPIIYQDKKSRDVYEFYSVLGDMRYQYYGYSGDYVAGGSIAITKQTSKIQTDNIELTHQEFTTPIRYNGPFLPGRDIVETKTPLSTMFDNYNYINTGNVSLSDISLKRFRELQISIYSKEHKQIEFYGDFRVDGAERVSATTYESEVITDENDPQYGSILLYPKEVPNMFKWEDSTFAEDNPTEELWKNSKDELGELWQLDLSSFPELDTINMKIELMGKGRRCSFQLLNISLQQYQLSNWMWVYRLMNARRK